MEVSRPSTARWVAGRWQRAQNEHFMRWRTSDQSVAVPQLITLCDAVNATVRQIRSSPAGLAERLLPTRRCCDDLQFRDDDEAAAYATQHLTDRYGRVTQVLERLFSFGHLPFRRQQLAVLEVGSGPAPALYAVRDFYGDIAAWSSSLLDAPQFAPVTVMHALDRGTSWDHLLRALSARLTELRFDLNLPLGTMPSGVNYNDLVGFSAHREHVDALENAAETLYSAAREPEDYVSYSGARWLAQFYGVDKPSAYDIVAMCNFLTTRESVRTFRRELRRLAFSLTPGGLLIVIGHPHGKKYDSIWLDLQNLMRRTNLTPLTGFAEPFPANPDRAWAAPIRRQRQEILAELYQAGVSLPDEFARLREDDPFPPFRALVWKNQQPPRRGRKTSKAPERAQVRDEF